MLDKKKQKSMEKNLQSEIENGTNKNIKDYKHDISYHFPL